MVTLRKSHEVLHGFSILVEDGLISRIVPKGKKIGYFRRTTEKIDVFYKGVVVVLELKASETLAPEDETQLINYLKASEIEVGLLMNFGHKPHFIRRILTNNQKNLKQKNVQQ